MPRSRTSSRRSERPTRAAAPPAVEESIVLALFDLANLLVRRGDQLASAAGLTTHEWLVLLQLAGDPNFPATGPAVASPPLASDIARARGVTRATVSAVVSSLKRRGLVKMTPDPEDARRHRLTVTPAGAARIAAIEPARQAANRRLLDRLDRNQRVAFHEHLRSCLDVLWELHEAERAAAAVTPRPRPRRDRAPDVSSTE
ncbi:MAG: MarR family winged helix-turn-helix transcriptional regulator [Deltaproteobacteria bacterium]|nr:MarR family winged helix-turn-helix transcriptional regulator [Kofleriaceae bacterium]